MHSSYDKKVITMFGVVGGYFVGHFYNNLYITANNRNKIKDASKSLTDEYKAVVKTYMYGVKHNPDYFSKTIKGIHTYYQEQTRYSNISLIEFLDKLLECFVPEEYFKDLKEADKEFFINKIILGSVMELGARILTFEKLSAIIDQHNDHDNVRVLQTDMVEIFSDIREQIFNQFTRQLTGKKAVETIDVNIANKLKVLLEQNLREKINAQTELEQSKKMIIALTQRITELEAELDATKSVVQPQPPHAQPHAQPQPPQTQRVQPHTQSYAQPQHTLPNESSQKSSRNESRRRHRENKITTEDPFDDTHSSSSFIIEKIEDNSDIPHRRRRRGKHTREVSPPLENNIDNMDDEVNTDANAYFDNQHNDRDNDNSDDDHGDDRGNDSNDDRDDDSNDSNDDRSNDSDDDSDRDDEDSDYNSDDGSLQAQKKMLASRLSQSSRSRR